MEGFFEDGSALAIVGKLMWIAQLEDVALLRGRALLLTGKHADAQQALRSISDGYIGEEPRYYLAVSLQKSGSLTEAREIWTDIRKRFRRARPGWRRSEKRWFKFAGERLKETKD